MIKCECKDGMTTIEVKGDGQTIAIELEELLVSIAENVESATEGRITAKQYIKDMAKNCKKRVKDNAQLRKTRTPIKDL